MRNLVLTGGPHPFDETTPRLVRMLADAGIESTVFDDIERGAQALAGASCELLTVHCLRWTMEQSAKYAPLRDTWGYRPSEATRAAIAGHVARGGGLLGLHTAAISFDTWPAWRDLLGASWTWGVSRHEPLGQIDVTIDAPTHPVTRGVTSFQCDDEAYGAMDVSASAVVLAHARARTEVSAHPSVLVQDLPSRGRSAYITIGHGASTFDHPSLRRLVTQAAAWCSRSPG